MNDVSSDRNPVEELAEEFIARYRRGERPALSEYTARRPDLSEQIRDLFPALVMMEDVRPVEGETAADRDPLPVLDQVGDFRIIREIGRGGMGIVYEAEQVSLGRHVALKVLPTSALLDPRKLQRFRREAKAAAGLHHTNIVPVHGMGSHEDVHFIVMQFIPGHGLDDILVELKRLRTAGAAGAAPSAPSAPAAPSVAALPRDAEPHAAQSRGAGGRDVVNITQSLLAGAFSGPVEVPAATAPGDSSTPHLSCSSASALSDTGRGFWHSVARVCMQAAEALDFAHRHGLLHRDIKPSNLLLDSSGTVWVTDFGLAKAAGDEEDLTESGDVVGTVRYLAPERFRGEADARSDVYSLGLTLYELLTLAPAFAETDRDRLLHQVAHEEPPRPRKRNPAIPRDLETIVLKAIAPEPKRRYRTAAELAADLGRFLEDKPIQARRAGFSERIVKWTRRRPAVATLLALVVVSTLGGVAGVVWKWRDAVSALEREQTALAKAERARIIADQEAERARREAQAAREVADVLAGMFEHSDALGLSGYLLNAKVERGGEQFLTGPQRPGADMMHALLDSGAEKVRRDLQGKPAIQAKLLETLGAVYLSMGELDKADDLLRAALDSRRRAAPADTHEAARALAGLGIIRFAHGRFDESLALLDQALGLQRATVAEDDPRVLTTAFLRAFIVAQRDNSAANLEELERRMRAVVAVQPPEYRERELSIGLPYLALAWYLRDNVLRATLFIYEHDRVCKDRDGLIFQLTRIRTPLAMNYFLKGDEKNALRVFREVMKLIRGGFGERHPIAYFVEQHLGRVLEKHSQWALAETIYRDALASAERCMGRQPRTAMAREDLARVLVQRGKRDEAAKLLQSALALRVHTQGADHEETTAARARLAQILR